MIFSPLEQFTVIPLLRIYNNSLDFTISNTTIFMILSALFIISLFKFVTHNSLLLSGRWQRMIELIYDGAQNQILEIMGKKGIVFIPFITSLFLFIFINNIIGLIPYSYTTTSQFIVALTFSSIVFFGVTFTGFKVQGLEMYKLFIPSGVPTALIPLMFIIELISYMSRLISLSIRLCANMTSGHIIVHLIAQFGFDIFAAKPILYIGLSLPILLLFPLMALELGVSLIQAFVFAVLTSTYIKDVIYVGAH